MKTRHDLQSFSSNVCRPISARVVKSLAEAAGQDGGTPKCRSANSCPQADGTSCRRLARIEIWLNVTAPPTTGAAVNSSSSRLPGCNALLFTTLVKYSFVHAAGGGEWNTISFVAWVKVCVGPGKTLFWRWWGFVGNFLRNFEVCIVKKSPESKACPDSVKKKWGNVLLEPAAPMF